MHHTVHDHYMSQRPFHLLGEATCCLLVICTRKISSSGNKQALAAQAVMLLPASACSNAMATLRGSAAVKGAVICRDIPEDTDCGEHHKMSA